MKVYHYTYFNNWRGIKKGTYVSNYEPGLAPDLPLGQMYRPARDIKAFYALFEPQPSSWKENPCFRNVWNWLNLNVGNLLLEIDVDPEKDTGIFVVDRGHMEGFLYEDKTHTPKHYLHDTREAAEKAYLGSKMTLRDYLAKQNEVNYSLPEVIITEMIPLERIKVSEQQPFLEEELKKEGKNPIKKECLFEIERTQELEPWINRNATLIGDLRASLGIAPPQNEGYGSLT